LEQEDKSDLHMVSITGCLYRSEISKFFKVILNSMAGSIFGVKLITLNLIS